MRPKLIEIDEARTRVLERTQRLEAEQVPLAHARGRVIAEQVASPLEVPGFDSSAMDGFAVRAADLARAGAEEPVTLTLAGESRAGHPARTSLPAGGAIAISTGAVLPEGADAVVPLELALRRDGRVEIADPPAPGAHVRLAGDDLRAGELVLGAGRRLGPAELGVLASPCRTEVACVRRARVCVITTGDELVQPGEPLQRGRIYDSNSFALPALVGELGAELASLESVADDAPATRAAIARALARGDVVILCGGVSVGEHDHVKGALSELGVEERFWGVALKPGKPTWFGTRAGALVFGLPGNPVSAMVTFSLLVAPALRALAGRHPVRRRAHAALAREYSKPAGRAHALRCRLRSGAQGIEADSAGDTGSHVLTSMLGAQALAIIPTACEHVRAGERVELELLGEPALAP